MTKQPRMIVLEGPDGVGKTTLAKALVTTQRQSGSDWEYASFPGREPGTLGNLVYRLHHQPQEVGVNEITPTSLQLLHIAAHLDAVDARIRPSIEANRTVVLDRFWWSTWVYGTMSGVAQGVLDGMIDLELGAWGTLTPDLLCIVQAPLPLKAGLPYEDFAQKAAQYEALAVSREHGHPIMRLQNVGTTESAVEAILRTLKGIA